MPDMAVDTDVLAARCRVSMTRVAMSTRSREAVWVLLSELFLDTEHTKTVLLAMARSLQGTGFSVEEVETILRREVAPVCGQWMFYSGAVGPWPMFDEQDLKERIAAHLRKPWYKRRLSDMGLMLPPGVYHDWEILRNAMRSEPDT